MVILLSVEGNIGCGKSTLLTKLKQHADAQHVPLFIVSQPTEELEQSGWLSRLYSNMSQNAFAFQVLILTKKLKSIVELYYKIRQQPNAIIVTERSIHSDTKVFTAALQSLGHIDSSHAAIIHELYHTLLYTLQLLDIRDKGFVYMNTSVNECFTRYALRSKPGELIVDKEYLKTLEAVYKVMLESRLLPCHFIEESYTDEDIEALLRWICSIQL